MLVYKILHVPLYEMVYFKNTFLKHVHHTEINKIKNVFILHYLHLF